MFSVVKSCRHCSELYILSPLDFLFSVLCRLNHGVLEFILRVKLAVGLLLLSEMGFVL